LPKPQAAMPEERQAPNMTAMQSGRAVRHRFQRAIT
jgi:hypothetical protein